MRPNQAGAEWEELKRVIARLFNSVARQKTPHAPISHTSLNEFGRQRGAKPSDYRKTRINGGDREKR